MPLARECAMISLPMDEADDVRFFIPPDQLPALSGLPWRTPLEEWSERRVKIIPVKSGLSRHIVRFVETGRRRFAIKETTLTSAQKEFDNYRDLLKREIPTLLPVGIVVRDDGVRAVETTVGIQRQQLETGYLVTELMEKVIPDSHLYRRGFSTENRKRIWDAVIELFVRLHGSGVYWGDASLANMLIHFSAELVPELGRRTRLRAVLADAETVEVHPTISDSLRSADVEFFLESMLWTEADLRASGIVRDPMVTQEDQQYVRSSYQERFAVEQEIRSFELVTHIDVDRLLGNFDAKGYGRLLLQHINEHKWYISERSGREIQVREAAEDWYRTIFRPVCRVFNDYGLLEFFPEKTASSLYVEIMEHKYFMSQRERRDVGLVAALEDYASRFARQEPVHLTFGSIIKALTALLTGSESTRHNIYLA
jgi:hypothetical protein